MGYHTKQDGHLDISPPLDPAQIAWVRAFAQSRRVCRHEERIASRPDPLREAVGLAVGADGAFYTGDLQGESDETVANWNYPADPVPSLYSAWTVSEDGARLTGRDQASYPTVWLEVFVEILVGWGGAFRGMCGFRAKSLPTSAGSRSRVIRCSSGRIVDDPEIARLALERDLPPESVLIAQRTVARAAAPKEGRRIVLPEDPRSWIRRLRTSTSLSGR